MVTIKSLEADDLHGFLDFFDHRAFANDPDWDGCYCQSFLAEQPEWDGVSEPKPILRQSSCDKISQGKMQGNFTLRAMLPRMPAHQRLQFGALLEGRWDSVDLVHRPWPADAPMPGSPPVGPLPFDRLGQLTFGSLNHEPKLSRPLIAAWAPFLLFALVGETVLVRTEE